MKRWTNMDGQIHVAGECCGPGSILGRNRCRSCGGRIHTQPVYGGLALLCENDACTGPDAPEPDTWIEGNPPGGAGEFV